MTELELNHVRKVYKQQMGDEIVAVEDLSLDLDEGEFLVLVGPSGCGKSTTLRCIAGLETVTDGEIRIGDGVVNDATPEERNIAMVFQNYALYPHMSARENMAFGLKMTTDLSKEERNARVEKTAEMLGIEDLLADKPKELSGGQQQRVALGRAIVREPTIFLMDEPLSNLDAKLRTQMRTEIQELQSEFDTTTVYVTHDQTEAMTMGDRIAVLDDGELQQVGTPLECYHQPANRFVGAFLGEPSMNMFEVRLDGTTLVGEAFEYELSSSLADRLASHGDITLGIRPEDVQLAEVGDGTMTAMTSVVEPMGSENVLHFDVDGRSVTVTVGDQQYVPEGTTVDLVFPEDRLHLFDSETGETLVNRDLPDDDASKEVLTR